MTGVMDCSVALSLRITRPLSMFEDGYFSDGDIAIVHKQDNFDSGNTCIILVNGDEATVKKVVRMDDGIDLIAMNPYYPVRHFSKNEMNEIPVKIIGKVVEARKRKAFE